MSMVWLYNGNEEPRFKIVLAMGCELHHRPGSLLQYNTDNLKDPFYNKLTVNSSK